MALTLGVGAIVLAFAAAAHWGWQAHGDSKLLAIDADRIPADRNLDAFARDRAAPVYRSTCARCHGEELAGNRRLGVPNLADRDWLFGDGRVSEIEETLTHGIRSGDPRSHNLASMPAYGQAEPYARYHIPPLSPQDIRDVTEYVLAIEARPADPAAAARGATIFQTRGGCYDCHGADAHGEGAIGAPNLRDRTWLYGDGSRAAIFDTIAHGRAGACPAWTGRLSAAQIRAVAVFIHDRARRGGA